METNDTTESNPLPSTQVVGDPASEAEPSPTADDTGQSPAAVPANAGSPGSPAVVNNDANLVSDGPPELVRYEDDVERALKTGFAEAGKALRAIRDSYLYQPKYPSFEKYVKVRWRWHRTHAYRLIAAANINEAIMSPDGDNVVQPFNEAQLRPLSRLNGPEQQKAAWDLAVQEAKGKAPSAAQVKRAADQVEPSKSPIIEARQMGAKKPAIEAGKFEAAAGFAEGSLLATAMARIATEYRQKFMVEAQEAELKFIPELHILVGETQSILTGVFDEVVGEYSEGNEEPAGTSGSWEGKLATCGALVTAALTRLMNAPRP